MKTPVFFCKWILMSLVCAGAPGQAAAMEGKPPAIGPTPHDAAAVRKTWDLSDERINHLLAGEVCEAIGLKESIDGRKRFGVAGWNSKQQQFSWPVQAAQAGTCQLSLLVNAPAGTMLVLKSHEQTRELVVNAAGWCRVAATLEIAKGVDVIQLGLGANLSKGKEAQLMSVEVITEKFRPTSERQIADLTKERGDCAWFQNAGFGLMFQ